MGSLRHFFLEHPQDLHYYGWEIRKIVLILHSYLEAWTCNKPFGLGFDVCPIKINSLIIVNTYRVGSHIIFIPPPTKLKKGVCILAEILLWIICGIYVLCLSCFRICSLLFCGHLLGKGWPLGSVLWCLIVSLSLSHVVTWIRCGTWLYWFLIIATFLTLTCTIHHWQWTMDTIHFRSLTSTPFDGFS